MVFSCVSKHKWCITLWQATLYAHLVSGKTSQEPNVKPPNLNHQDSKSIILARGYWHTTTPTGGFLIRYLLTQGTGTHPGRWPWRPVFQERYLESSPSTTWDLFSAVSQPYISEIQRPSEIRSMHLVLQRTHCGFKTFYCCFFYSPILLSQTGNLSCFVFHFPPISNQFPCLQLRSIAFSRSHLIEGWDRGE